MPHRPEAECNGRLSVSQNVPWGCMHILHIARIAPPRNLEKLKTVQTQLFPAASVQWVHWLISLSIMFTDWQSLDKIFSLWYQDVFNGQIDWLIIKPQSIGKYAENPYEITDQSYLIQSQSTPCRECTKITQWPHSQFPHPVIGIHFFRDLIFPLCFPYCHQALFNNRAVGECTGTAA